MNKAVAVLRDRAWLFPARIRRIAVVAAASSLLFPLLLVLTAHGLNDYSGRPLGTDFSSFYTAGRLAGEGGNPYDPVSLHAMQQAIFGKATPYYAFAYPPIFLLLARPLALLAYLPALAVWQASTFTLYIWAMSLLKRRHAPALPDGLFYLCAAGFPAVFVNVTHGQNGFLTGALFAAALACMDVRPWLAGICFGLAAYKPQLGLVVPFALAAGAYWRSFAAAAATILVAALVSAFAFGVQIWPEFFVGANISRHVILDENGVGYPKFVSVFAWLRLWHLPSPVAYTGQALAAVLAIGMTLRLWRPDVDHRLRGAGLCLATLLATPFALDYDLMIAAPAILLLAAYEMESPIPFGASLLFFLWFIPLFARSIALFAFIPLANWVVIGNFAVLMRRARS